MHPLEPLKRTYVPSVGYKIETKDSGKILPQSWFSAVVAPPSDENKYKRIPPSVQREWNFDTN